MRGNWERRIRKKGRTWKGMIIFVWGFLKCKGGTREGNWGSDLEELSQGTGVVGNFGLKGQKIARIPRDRESKRLFLVGWEVNIQSGKEQGKEKEHDQTENGLDKPNWRWRYVLCCCCSHYFVVVFFYSWFLPSIRKSLKEILNWNLENLYLVWVLKIMRLYIWYER